MMFRLARHFNPHILAAAALAVPCSALMQGAEKPETKVYQYSAPDVEKLASTPPAPALDPTKFQSFRLVRRERISPDSSRLTFALPRENDELGLSVASLLVVQGPNLDNGQPAVRPYTPTSRVHDRGQFELIVKSYPTGKVSKWLDTIPIGTEVPFKGPFVKFDYTPNQWDAVGMIAGGSGITPMYQLIREILENPRDYTEVRLIFANRTPADVLLKDELDALAVRFPNFKVLYTVDSVPAGAAWAGATGHVTKELVASFLPPPGAAEGGAVRNKLLVCGPPPMVAAVSGPKKSPSDQGPLLGLLRDMHYTPEQVFKY